MPVVLRLVVAVLLAVCCVTAAGSASAWVSVRIHADKATIQVSPDGSALVSHDILLRLRGGPLETLRFTGVDTDAVADGAVTLTRAKSGKAAGPPVLMTHSFQDGEAVFEVSKKQGIRSGSYLLQFAYKTDLRAQGGLRAAGEKAELSWTGPSFDDGIGSLQTTFVLPRASAPPHLPNADPEQSTGLVTRSDGVYLSELQRGDEVDRLVLTRPHVAKGQQVTWVVHADRSLFTELAEPTKEIQRVEPFARVRAEALHARERSWLLSWVLAVGLALGFALLVNLKQRSAKTSFLVPLRSWCRQLLLFASMALSLAFALVYESAALAGLLLIVAMLVALQRPVRPPIEPKGPGRWRPVEFDKLAHAEPGQSVQRSWLDASSGVGLVLFTLTITAFAVFGLRLLGRAPYHSAMVLVYSTALVPLFFTLGSANGQPLLEEQREFLFKLQRRLGRHKGITCSLQGRFALDAEVPDDLRLRVALDGARPGLLCLDVGVGFVDTTLRRLLVPALVVRVREDSPAHRALPRDAHWSPGHNPDERVAVIRAPLPLLSSTVETLVETASRLAGSRLAGPRKGTAPKASRAVPAGIKDARRVAGEPQPRESSSAKSGARGSATSKRSSAVLPSQVTR